MFVVNELESHFIHVHGITPQQIDHFRKLCLSSTDRDVIERAHEIAGVGGIDFIKRQKEHWSDKWRWRVSKRKEIAYIASTLLPYLGERRSARVEDFLNWYQSVQ